MGMKYKNGDIYDGEWVFDKKHGKGIMTINGDKYKGEWDNDKKQGKFEIELKNKDKIFCEFDKKGELICDNGDIYIGEFFHNKKHRNGIMKYINGDIYDGNWLDDEKHKNGIMKYKNGDIYDGNWLDDEKHKNGI